jgi:hypothetical protein
MGKRKATAILESLKEEPEVVPETVPKVVPEIVPEVVMESKPEPTIPQKRKAVQEKDIYKLMDEKITKFKNTKDDFQKKMEERESRLEMRLENMIQRKFMEVKSLAQPVQNYKPRQPAEVIRVQPVREKYQEWDGYATQEEEEEEVRPPVKSHLYNKIFG